jgi:hypothetical protein
MSAWHHRYYTEGGKNMLYLLIICHDDRFAPTEQLTKEIIAWNKAMKKSGILKYSNPLKPAGEAITIRIRKGKLHVTDGPFSDTIEQITAYALIDCPDFQEAVKAASTHPMAKAATIEVRPVWSDLKIRTRRD